MSAIPYRTDLLSLINPLGSNDNVVRLAAITALYTAAQAATNSTAGFTTAAISKGTEVANEIEKLFLELAEHGYTVTNGSTTFTISC